MISTDFVYLVGLGAISKGTAWKDLPVVKHTLWEGLASSVGPQVSCEHGGVEHSPGGGDNLTSASVDGVRVQGDVVDVEPDCSQVFVTHHTLNRQERLREQHTTWVSGLYLNMSI